jgi:excinuclease UvrABC nuclease subunit
MASTRDPIQGSIAHPGFGADGETAVYRIYDQDGSLLYVGMGRNPMNRWAAHAENHAWWPRAASFRVEWYATRKEAFDVELQAIRTEDPECNIHSRPGWGKEMYVRYMEKLEENRKAWAERQSPAA